MIDPRPYLGVPYVDRGRSLESDGGWDCWGLVIEVYRREAGIVLPVHDTDPRDRAAVQAAMAEQAGWWWQVSLAEARPLDVALLKDAGRPTHVGVFIQPPLFLHACRGIGVSVADIATRSQPWHRWLIAVHRHPALL